MADADPFPAVAEKTAATAALPPSDSYAAPADAAKTNRWRLPLMLIVPLLIIGGTLYWWLSSADTVSTDNAYVKQEIVSIAGEVQGQIVSVSVRENQFVRAGDVLFTIDPAPYEVAIRQADAQIASAQANITAMQADVGASAAEVAGARDDLKLAEANYAREKALMDRGFNTRARMDAAQHSVASARDRIVALQAGVARDQAKLATGSAVPGVNPAIAAAQASKAKAQLDLQRTVVRAPADGIVTQASRLQVGQMVFSGVPMISLVRAGGGRIDANFKETDLARMRPGQPAEIHLDAYPGLVLKGHVESIGVGTGSEFSVLPAQNATGNWVKIIQRVPVRIAIDSRSDRPLIAGLSAKVKVDVGQH
jgi:membrane fusion protein (multidrug efflux system)